MLPDARVPGPLAALRRTYMYLNIRRLLRPYKLKSAAGRRYDHRVPLPRFRRNMEWMVGRQQRDRFRFVLLIPPRADSCQVSRRRFLGRSLPSNGTWAYPRIAGNAFKGGHARWTAGDYANLVRWLAPREKLLYVDLPDVFNRSYNGQGGALFDREDGYHPTALGHGAIAKATVSRLVRPDLLGCGH